MKISLPANETKISIPEEWKTLSASNDIVHHELWTPDCAKDDICIGSTLQPCEVVEFTLNLGPRRFVQYNPLWFKEDVEMALNLSKNPGSYFQDPVGTVLNVPLKSDFFQKEWAFKDGSAKHTILEDIYRLLPAPGQALKDAVRAVYEELYMNAVLDAPRESIRSGQEKYGYEKRDPARITLGFDGSRLALACADPYGTLDITRFLNRMNEVYKRGAGQVVNLVREKGGAGLGCVILFEQSSSLFLGVEAGKNTTVTCQIPLSLNHRQRASVQKSLYILEG